MEYKEMTVEDVPEVVKFYYQLAYFIKDETGDEYFNSLIYREKPGWKKSA